MNTSRSFTLKGSGGSGLYGKHQAAGAGPIGCDGEITVIQIRVYRKLFSELLLYDCYRND